MPRQGIMWAQLPVLAPTVTYARPGTASALVGAQSAPQSAIQTHGVQPCTYQYTATREQKTVAKTPPAATALTSSTNLTAPLVAKGSQAKLKTQSAQSVLAQTI